jgi:CRP/FNR family cyclic AMP-dependent transcriptional regulator
LKGSKRPINLHRKATPDLRDKYRPWKIATMAEGKTAIVAATTLLTRAGSPRHVQLEPQQILFAQGSSGKTLFYITRGRGKLAISSSSGKQATISVFTAGDFVGEESLAGGSTKRTATATATTRCTALEIDRDAMIRLLQMDHDCSDLFLERLLARSMRLQASLVDQRFNSSAKRLARTLLLMAEAGEPSGGATLIPAISQTALAQRIGATRSRVSDLMKRFKELGFIENSGGIRVHKTLTNVLLHDEDYK